MNQKNGDRRLLPGIRDSLLADVDSELRRLKICVLTVFLIGFAAHGWGMMHLNLNQDSLSEFYWTSARGWKFYLGRFAEPILRFLMGEFIVLPWLTSLSALIFLSLAVYGMARLFSLDRVWELIVLGGICVANSALTTLIATYIHDFAGDMLSLLLAVAAACLWAGMQDRFSWKNTLLGTACLTLCFGIYQAYLAVMATIVCFYGVISLLRGRKAGETIRHLLRVIPMVVFSVAAYGFCVWLVSNVYGTAVGGNGGNDMTQVGNNLRNLLWLTLQGYVQVACDLFLPHGSSVKALEKWMTCVVCVINIVLFLKSAAIVVGMFKKKRMKGPEVILTLALILLLPFAMSCVSIVSTVFHYLMRYAVYLFYLVVLVLLKMEREDGKCDAWRQLAVLGMVSVVIACNLQVSNTAYEKKDYEQKATIATMTRVLDRLEAYEGYEFETSQVAICGVISSHKERMQVGYVDYMLGMGPSSALPYDGLDGVFLKTTMAYPLNLCPPEKEREIMETEAFKAMGSFPAKDCIATIDGIVVVKLSDSNFNYS